MPANTDVVKVDIDLIKVDALVLQKNTARTEQMSADLLLENRALKDVIAKKL